MMKATGPRVKCGHRNVETCESVWSSVARADGTAVAAQLKHDHDHRRGRWPDPEYESWPAVG